MMYKRAQDILLHEIVLTQAGIYPRNDADSGDRISGAHYEICEISIGSKTFRQAFPNAHDYVRGSIAAAPSAASLRNVISPEPAFTHDLHGPRAACCEIAT
jgi:hypothetical protein